MSLGHDPDEISIRHALTFAEHDEEVWEQRASVVAKGISEAFSE